MAKDNYNARAYNFLVKSGYIDPQEVNFNSFNSQMSNPDFSRSIYSNFQDAKQKGKIGTLKPFEEFVAEFQVATPATMPPVTQAPPPAQAGGGVAPDAPQTPQTTPTGLPVMQDGTQMPTGGGQIPGMPQLEMPVAPQGMFNQQVAQPIVPEQTKQPQGQQFQWSGNIAGGEPEKPQVSPVSSTSQMRISAEEKPKEMALAQIHRNAMNQGELATLVSSLVNPTPESIQRIAQINAEMENAPQSEAMRNLQEEGSFANMLQATPEVIYQSLASMIRSGYGTILGSTATGAAAGSFIPGLGNLAGAGYGLGAGMGAAGSQVEYASSLMEGLREQGVNVSDPNQLELAFANPNIINNARKFAAKRTAAIMVFDAATMGFAGKFGVGKASSTLGNVARLGGELGVQATGGSAGEAFAQFVSGQEMSSQDIIMEGLGELGGAGGDIYSAKLRAVKTPQQVQADANRMAVNAPMNPEQVDAFVNTSVEAGFIAPDNAGQAKTTLNKANELNSTIPEDIKEQGSRIAAIGIIEERNKLTAQLEGIDEAFKPQIQEKIKALNQQLQELGTIGLTPEAQTFFDSNEASLTNPIATMPTEVETTFGKISDGIMISPEGLSEAYNWVNESFKAVVGNQALSPAEKGATLNILNGMLSDIDKANTEGQRFVEEVETASVQDRVPAVREGVATLPQGQNPSEATAPVPTPSITKAREVKQKTNVLPSSGEVIVTPAPVTINIQTPKGFTQELKNLGYSDEDISKMSFEQQQEIVTNKTEKPEVVSSVSLSQVDENGKKSRINEIETMLASDAKSMADTGMGMLIPEAKVELQNELSQLKQPSSPQAQSEVTAETPALADKESTAKALEGADKDPITKNITGIPLPPLEIGGYKRKPTEQYSINDANSISTAYHKAKQDGSNPELVKAVEAILTPETQTTPQTETVETVATTDEAVGQEGGVGKGEKEVNPVRKLTDTPSLKDIEIVSIENANLSASETTNVAESISQNNENNSWNKALRNNVENLGNGWFLVGKTMGGESILHSPTTNETYVLKSEKGGIDAIVVNDFLKNNNLTEQATAQTTPTAKPSTTPTQPTPEAKPKTPLINEARNARRQAQAKAKAPTQDQRVKAREAYFKPGAIVESYGGGKDKVIEYNQDPNDPTKWSVTVQGVDAQGNPVGEQRTHKTEPTDKEYKRAGVEVKAEKTTTPPTPKEVKENSEKVYNDAQSTFVFPFGLNPKFKFDVRLPENVQRFFKKYFRPRGLWTPELFKGKRSNEGRIASQAERAKFKIRDLQEAISDAYPNGVKESDVKRMNEFLQGNAIELPPALYKPLEAMREDIDRLSRIMIEEGIIDQKLVPVFNANMGIYTTRTYDIHNDPESWISYIKNTPEGEQVRNKAVNWLRQEYEARADRADKLADKSEARAVSFSNQAQKTQDPDKILELEYYADRAIQRADKLRAQAEALRQGDFDAKIDEFLFDESQPLGIVKKGKYGSKDLGILQKRKDIPEVIRELMGEAQDPITNYTMSVAKMASLISNNKFLNEAKVQGLKDGTFTTEAKGKNIVKIASESTDSMNPLNGLYTTEEIAQAFEEYQKVTESPDYIKLMLRLNGMIKLGKTVLSPTTHVRNFGSNIIIEVGNGSFSLKGLKEAGASQYEQIFGLKTGDRKEKVREYVEKLIKLGVLGSGANYGDMLAYYDDIRSGGKYDYQKVIEPKLKSGLKSGMDAIKNLYRAEDDFFKVHAFEDERATLKKAYGNTKTDEQLDELAADKVLKTRINYDMAPKIVDAIRKVPFMGTFPTFPAEVVRISVNIPTVAVEEMRSGNKVLQKRGAQRMAGFMVAVALPKAINEISRYFLGIDDEEEEARKLFIAPWSQNSTLVWLDKDRYVDTGYSDAFNTIKTPVVAALKGADLTAGVVAGIMDFVDPYISGEIGFKMVKEISDNRDEYDNPVYNENADAGTQLSQIFGFAMKKAEPGFVSQARRFYKGETGELAEKGQKYSTKDELINLTLGQKVVTVDWDNAVLFKLKANAEDIKDSNSFYNKANKQLPEKDKKGRVQEAEATNLAVERSVEQLREYYNATKAMGFSTAKTVRLMKEANIPKDIILAVATNQPYKNFLIVTKSGTVIDRNTQRLLGQ
jgi:hypothetical protein